MKQEKYKSVIMDEKKQISLILGSGGARGYSHIGVIEELEKSGYEIASISGSSMGALIGGTFMPVINLRCLKSGYWHLIYWM